MAENLPRSTEIGTTQKERDKTKGQHLDRISGQRSLCSCANLLLLEMICHSFMVKTK